MKRSIFILLLLTIVVILPPIYLRGSESKRLNQIREMKEQARPVFGEQLEIVLSELRGGEPPSVVILHTGDTKSHLEPCGCYQEQSGGLPRRAYIVNRIRQFGVSTLLVDAGNIFHGKEEIDAKRCEVNLRAMSTMGYDVVALNQADLSYGDMYLRQRRAVTTFPFLASEESDFTQRLVIKETGAHTIAFVADAVEEQAVSEASVVVALGNPGAAGHINVVIQPEQSDTVRSEDGTLYVGSAPEGRTLGFLALWINSDGEIARHYTTQLSLTGDVGESESVRQLLTDFYREVGESSDVKPLFAEQHLERDPRNGYVSATACQQCHQQEYLQWSASRHAFAFETLLKKERYFDSGCVSCHTTGFGYPTGFQIEDPHSTLKGVQCETCHGPGKQHVSNPKKTNIRSGADTSLCLKCHDTKHSPGFAAVVGLHAKDVDHSRDPMNLEELLTSRISRVGKPTLELFVMSYCPFGVQAEEKILPIVKKFGDTIDFKLRFIAEEKQETSQQDITQFRSLHGSPEVAENIRQLLIEREYPDQYLDYILCRGKKLEKSWEDCAEKLGIDVSRIQEVFSTPEAERLFRENIKRALELGIRSSPTVLVDTHQFRVSQLLRARGTPCQ